MKKYEYKILMSKWYTLEQNLQTFATAGWKLHSFVAIDSGFDQSDGTYRLIFEREASIETQA